MAKPGELYGRPWSEREYLIVLDSYFKHKGHPRHHLADYIKEVAKLLGRTPASIVMRMENFASIDPDEAGQRRGLGNIGPMGQKVFSEWSNRKDHLQSVAEVLAREEREAGELTLFEPDPVAIPKAFGKYELLDLLGTGGFGAVYSCVNAETSEVRAIKIIKVDKLQHKESLHRFSREIRALKSIGHKNIIRLHDDNLDSEDAFPAYVMDLADSNLTSYATTLANSGRSTHARSGLDETESLEIIRSILKAVEILHSNSPRIIHRDINPNNILRLPDGTWALSDFSLVKFIQTAPMSTSFLTTAHVGWGTGYYAAPEQYRDFASADERTDIYALGMLIWELLTTSGPPPDKSALGLPAGLTQVFLKATARNSVDRYSTIKELTIAFEAALIADGVLADGKSLIEEKS